MPEFGSDVVQALIIAGRPWPMSGGPVDAGTLLWAAEPGTTGESAAMLRALRRLRKTPDRGTPPPESTDDPVVQDLDVADPLARLLREAAYLAGAQRVTRNEPPPAQWRASAVSGLRAALDEAGEAGVAHVGRVHVLTGVLRSPGAATHGLPADPADRAELAATIRADPCWRESGRPNRPAVAMLDGRRELVDRAGFAGWRDRRLRRSRQYDRYGTGAVRVLLCEATRQAARLGDGPVTSAHLLLGVAGMAAQLRAADRRLRPAVRPFNAALDALSTHGVTLDRAVAAMPDARVADLAVVPHGRAQLVVWFPGPGWTAEAVDAVERAVALARDAGHPETGSSHLTVAALDADGTAARLVRALGADPGAVRDDVARTLP
ncbi:Clp protease N-terminal domain-containing protein [Dactylosporangium sp. NPDC000521]|uniref:Clp protease N-terminal domain-containing protein n=1 Tax=Dactylosporangium sp. NPDC000521 TaxID=3363975 RepID=UPI0036A919B3